MIRLAVQEDASSILGIYKPFILTSGITQETEVPLINEFQQRIMFTQAERPWLVCELNGEIAGYAYAAKHRERSGYQWCVESSVYISEKYFGKKAAFALYTALVELLKLQGYINVYAVITLPNDRSTAFHEKFGFTYLFTFKNIGFKLGKWHDVGWWFLQINSYPGNPSLPLKFPELNTGTVQQILDTCSSLLRK